MPAKNRKVPDRQKYGQAQILASITRESAQALYSKELKERSLSSGMCTVSTRKLALGQYPRVVVPKHLLLDPVLQELPQQQRRVSVAALAFKSSGNIIPHYSQNLDLKHSCSRGKCSLTNPQGCITQKHLSLGSHAENMAEQHCVPVVSCKFCGLLSLVCHHNPRCVSSLSEMILQQKRVNRVVIEYSDGSTVIKDK